MEDIPGPAVYQWRHGDPGDPLLVCLHGIGSCADAFGPQRPLAEQCNRQIVAWDAPGYRHSPPPVDWDQEVGPGLDGFADAAASMIHTLSPDRPAAVLGVSWGGVTATRLALRHPDLVELLILADSSVGSGVTAEKADAMRQRPNALVELGPDRLAAERAPNLLSAHPDPELLARVGDLMARSIKLPGYRWAAESMAGCDHRDDLASIRQPTLVIVGADDTVTPPHQSAELAESIDGAELVTIPAAGHLANQERPDEFNRMVASFLDRNA